jgi:hypothetical protein
LPTSRWTPSCGSRAAAIWTRSTSSRSRAARSRRGGRAGRQDWPAAGSAGGKGAPGRSGSGWWQLTRPCPPHPHRHPGPAPPPRQDSFLDEGFILDKKIGVGQPRRIENAKVLIANTPMDTDKIKIYGARVKVDSMAKVGRAGGAGGGGGASPGVCAAASRLLLCRPPGHRQTRSAPAQPTPPPPHPPPPNPPPVQVAEIEAAEKAKMREKCEKILGHGINCFINRQLIYNYPEEIFTDAGAWARAGSAWMLVWQVAGPPAARVRAVRAWLLALMSPATHPPKHPPHLANPQTHAPGIMSIEHADFDGIERLALVLGGEIASTFDTPADVGAGGGGGGGVAASAWRAHWVPCRVARGLV